LQEVLEVLDASEAMRCVLLCMLEDELCCWRWRRC